MTKFRIIFGSVFLVVFVSSFVVAVLGATSVIEMSESVVLSIFTVFGLECIAAIVAAFRNPDFFRDDPEDIAHLKKKHASAMSELEEKHRKEKADIASKHQKVKSQLEKENSDLRVTVANYEGRGPAIKMRGTPID